MFRHEVKYVISSYSAELLKAKIASVCEADSHAFQNGAYYIKSLYLDTIDDRFLAETINGVNVRHKYRIRTYNNESSRIRLEEKFSENGLKHKEACNISLQQFLDIQSGNILTQIQPGQDVLGIMQGEYLASFLKPTVIVSYKRVPYVYPSGNVRITFDYDICASSPGNNFFEDNGPMYNVTDQSEVVLEVKYDELLPKAIKQILDSSGLGPVTAFSKYAMARETLDKMEG